MQHADTPVSERLEREASASDAVRYPLSPEAAWPRGRRRNCSARAPTAPRFVVNACTEPMILNEALTAKPHDHPHPPAFIAIHTKPAMFFRSVLLASLAAVVSGFLVPSAAPVTRARGVMQMLKVRQFTGGSKRVGAGAPPEGIFVWGGIDGPRPSASVACVRARCVAICSCSDSGNGDSRGARSAWRGGAEIAS